MKICSLELVEFKTKHISSSS